MKPATSALNDWVQRIVVNPLFKSCPTFKMSSHWATIKIGFMQTWDFECEHYVNDCVIDIVLRVAKTDILSPFKHYVSVTINTPTCFLGGGGCSSKNTCEYTNITLKNLFEFVKIYEKMYLSGIHRIYSIPNRKCLAFRGNESPLNFESYVKQYEHEFELFTEFKESLFRFLAKCEATNTKHKEIKKEFRNEEIL